MTTCNEHTFAEEREPNGRLIVGPCLGCGLPALSAIGSANRELAKRDQEYIELAESKTRGLATLQREIERLSPLNMAGAYRERIRDLEAQVRALREWKHICVVEACCIENGFHALAIPPAPQSDLAERGDTYADGSSRFQDDPPASAEEEE